MEYEFYIDVFFLADFYLNLLSLFLSAALLRQKLRLGRLCLAAAIGSFWNCLFLVFPVIPPKMELLVTAVVVGGIMLTVAFRELIPDFKHSALLSFEKTGGWLWRLLRAEACLLLSSGLLSGCLMFSSQHFYLSDVESLAFAGLLCLPVERFLRKRYKNGRIGDHRYRVRLYYQGNVRSFCALTDSGNRLRVPETGGPVSLISYKDCTGFCDTVSGGFYIPYRAVGTEKGLLFAMWFEKMEIETEENTITIENPAVAIVKESLSANGDFTMILPEEYVPGE